MGVNLKELVIKQPITFEDLAGKVLAVDAYNILYQFLSTIRTREGRLLTDSKGRVTSHLIGLFSRTANFLKHGLRPVFVFDGKVPALKYHEIEKREAGKEAAEERYAEAVAAEDVEAMRKFGARTARLSKDMVEEAKTLLTLLGIPVVQAPSEGEAQASFMVRQGDAWAVVSQDYDSLLYGADRLIQNLSVAGRRKKAGVLGTIVVRPEMIELKRVLKDLGITQDQLIALAMLVGTDYHPAGVKGIGPKKALALVKEHKTPANIFKAAGWDKHCAVPWQEIFDLFKVMPVTKDYQLKFRPPDKGKVAAFLVGEHDFSAERVDKTLADLHAAHGQRSQRGLGDF